MDNPPPFPAAEPTLPFTEIYALLTSFHQSNGSLNLPPTHPTTLKIMDLLSSLGTEELMSDRWESNFNRLRTYKSKQGNCAIETVTESTEDAEIEDLKEWTVLQRECYRNYEALGGATSLVEQRGERVPSLSVERYLKLKNVGLTVNKWEKRLVELRQFKFERGHCDVPIDHPGGLGLWVATQRETYKFEKESMPIERIDALEQLQFSWNRWGRQRSKSRKDAWDKMYHELIEYKNANGDCNISQYDENNKQLGKWAKNQRYEYRRYHNKGLGQSRISRDRIDKLNSIGFQWRLKPEKVSWEERFRMLKRYKEENGHCRPPQNHPEIGSWAKYQRNQLQCFIEGKESKVDQEKVDKLLSIGFNDPPPSRSERVDDSMMQQVDNPDSADAQQKRARRMARMRRNGEQIDHPHAFQYDNYPPQYEFDPNANIDAFYPQYDHGNPLMQDENGQVYSQGYGQYHYQTGV